MGKNIISLLLFSLIFFFFTRDFFWARFILNIFVLSIGFYYVKTSKKSLNESEFYLIIIPIIIGIIIGLLKFSLRDVLRDIYYYIIPVVCFFLGYIVSKLYTKREILKNYVYWGLVFSILQIFLSIAKFNFNLMQNFTQIRNEVSPGNSLTLISIMIIIFDYKYKLKLNFKYTFIVFALLTNIFAFILFGSRTYLLLSVIFLFFFSFKKIFRRRFLVIIFLFIGAGLTLLSTVNIKEREDGEEFTFVGKLQESVLELGTDEFLTERDVITKYRAYETLMASRTFSAGTFLQKTFGQGFGAMIDLEIDVYLTGDEPFRFIPILHNGFMYLLIKVGFVGTFLNLLFFVKLIRKTYRISKELKFEDERLFIVDLLMGSIVGLTFSNFVVSSYFNLEFEFMTILIFALFFKIIEHKRISLGIDIGKHPQY